MKERFINEEITKAEIRSMIDSKVSDYIKEKEFENEGFRYD